MEWFMLAMIPLLGFMMWSSSKKQKAQVAAQRKMQDEMLPGTRIMTTSGLYANVVEVGDKTIDLEIADGVVTTWLKAAVREIVEEEEPESTYSAEEFSTEIPDYVPDDLDSRTEDNASESDVRPEIGRKDGPIS